MGGGQLADLMQGKEVQGGYLHSRGRWQRRRQRGGGGDGVGVGSAGGGSGGTSTAASARRVRGSVQQGGVTVGEVGRDRAETLHADAAHQYGQCGGEAEAVAVQRQQRRRRGRRWRRAAAALLEVTVETLACGARRGTCRAKGSEAGGVGAPPPPLCGGTNAASALLLGPERS